MLLISLCNSFNSCMILSGLFLFWLLLFEKTSHNEVIQTEKNAGKRKNNGKAVNFKLVVEYLHRESWTWYKGVIRKF